MKVSDLLKIMFLVTFLGVLYIHIQMSIYALAYQGKARQQKIEKLAEVNAMTRNDIVRLKSSDNIGRKLLAKDKQYRFVDRDNIVEVASENPSIPEMLASGARATGGFFSHVATIALSPAQPGLSR